MLFRACQMPPVQRFVLSVLFSKPFCGFGLGQFIAEIKSVRGCDLAQLGCLQKELKRIVPLKVTIAIDQMQSVVIRKDPIIGIANLMR